MPKIYDDNLIRDRLTAVRTLMEKDGVDAYIIYTGDYHMSEYASDYFSEREFLSGFTGSAGELVVLRDKAALFTDGRYFVQAELQIKGKGIELMRKGQEGVPDIYDYLCQDAKLQENAKPVLGFDARTIDAASGLKFEKVAKKLGGSLAPDFNPVARIWEDRPAFPASKIYEIETGKDRKQKLSDLRSELAKKLDEDYIHFISSLDDIAWLLNLRANDVECNPVFMSYLILSPKECRLYANLDSIDEKLSKKLEDDGVSLFAYDSFYGDINKVTSTYILANQPKTYDLSLAIDAKRVNCKIYGMAHALTKAAFLSENNEPALRQALGKVNIKLECFENPTVLAKAIKNDYEIKNLIDLHVDDGLAVTRFIIWLKEKMADPDYDKAPITEYDAALYLDALREKIDDYIELSFGTISAYGANAAQMHYAASKDDCAYLERRGMLLVDSGGQYLRGTSDVTRTIALGPVTPAMKKDYTLSLKGMLALADAVFLEGCSGYSLDILARGPLWKESTDYRCGTGHGVGYLLNVHESPNAFRYRYTPGLSEYCKLEPGMVTSDEPGVYRDGQYGIRIENMILCEKDGHNEYGQFLRFKTLTIVPLDEELIDRSLLNEDDILRLENYQKFVYDTLSARMSDGERKKLAKLTCQA